MEGNYCKECLVTGRLEHDIVSSLPHELVIHVVEYIDVADIVRCQMVSKRWWAIFSSDTVIKPSLSQTMELLGLDSKSVEIAPVDPKTYFR
ncbi:hypothetical protein VTN49DRAFT_6659 [Thermomyces lanuginosus]|uniref:uncharacterized protein n=1 Tax=Thermomyces lanuginosus TaxID=5541 RepID=UPI0037421FBB